MSEIKGIWGAEPLREREYPEAYIIGHEGITRIERREENLGTYGIVWFDAFKGDTLAASMNAAFVASVAYASPSQTQPE